MLASKEKQIKNLIQYRSNGENVYHNLFRALKPDFPRLEYNTTDVSNIYKNCHYGQRKLFYTELEFLSLLSKKHHLREVTVVYAGAAPGIHLPILFKLFPDVFWILIDPAPFKFDKEGHTHRFVIINDFYTSSTYKTVQKINTKNKKVAFISDIRVAPSEEETFKDMVAQQLWVTQLDNCCAYMLKFRLPYILDTFKYEAFDYQPPKGTHIALPTKRSKGFLYLSGKILFQLYPPMRSSESRLIGYHKQGHPFQLQYYDAHKYDEQMNYFNMVARRQCYRYKGSQTVKEHILGFDDGYESVVEYYLFWKYLQHYQNETPTHEAVVRLLYATSRELDRTHSRSLVDCVLVTIAKKKNVATEGDKKVLLQNMALSISKKTQESLLNQVRSLKKSSRAPSPLLTQQQYKEQLQEAAQTLRSMTVRG